MEWTWNWVPGHFDATWGDNPVFDWVRALCVVVDVVLMMYVGRVLVEAKRRPLPMPRTQAFRFVSLALFALSTSLTEIAVAGTPATPRLAVNVVATVLGVLGIRGIRRKQRATPPVR